jgi:hypothetical protein
MHVSSVAGCGLVLLAVATVAAGCSSGSGGGNGCTVAGVAVVANPSSISTGDTTMLTATLSTTGTCTGGVTWSATPSGGTLTPNGTTATFGSTTPGTYTITATSTEDTSKSGSAMVSVTAAVACGTANGTIVTHSANITASETWAGDGVTHSVPNSIAINGPATVTVEPCALITLAQGASITVNAGGKLVAAGTSNTRFVAFLRSDSTKPWGILRGTSTTTASGVIELHWTVVQGGGAFGGEYHNPAIAMAGLGYSALPTPMLKVDNVVIDTPQGVGVYFDGNAAFTSDSQSLTVQNAPGYVFETTMMSVGSIPSGTYTSGNTLPFAIVDVGPNANVFADMTIANRLPVIIAYGGMNIGPPGGSGPPVTLTLGPGVQLFFNGTRVIFGGNGSQTNNSVGVLHALGTAAQPILFSSAMQSPAPGDWVGLWLDTATGSQLDYVIIEYAGGVSGIVSANCKPTTTHDYAALIVGDFSTQYVPPADLITNSVIQHSAGFGIDAVWQAGTYNTPDLTATNQFQDNVGCAQTYNALSSGSCPNGGGCTAP